MNWNRILVHALTAALGAAAAAFGTAYSQGANPKTAAATAGAAAVTTVGALLFKSPLGPTA